MRNSSNDERQIARPLSHYLWLVLAVAVVLCHAAPLRAQTAQGQWRLVTPRFASEETFVAFEPTADLAVMANSGQDATAALQTALDSAAAAGGGTIFLPAGQYTIRGHIDIPTGVCLRGEWRAPGDGLSVSGTILMAYAGRGQDNPPRQKPKIAGAVPSFISLNKSAALEDVSIWYPEQTPDGIAPYPPAVLLAGNYATAADITLVNAYRGIACAQDNWPSSYNLRNIDGSPLAVGIEIDSVADVGRMQNVRFSPRYWTASGLPGSPGASGSASDWIASHGVGVLVRRYDWSYTNDIAVSGYSVGFKAAPSLTTPGSRPNGYCDDMTLSDCGIGIEYENGWLEFSHVRVSGCGVDLQADSDFTGLLKMEDCLFADPKAAVSDAGSGPIMIQHCDFHGPISMNAGSLTFVDSTDSAPAPQLTLAAGVTGASLAGNRFETPLSVAHGASTSLAVSTPPHPSAPMPEVTWESPLPYCAARKSLYIATDAAFGAKPDPTQDAAPSIQRALDTAAAHGGGIVFLPPGEYALHEPLTVGAGVELRGAEDWPHDTLRLGTVLDLYAGRDSASGGAICLAATGGARGFTVAYPDQHIEDVHPYPATFQLRGAKSYVCDIAALNPYYLVDAASYRCDDHYIARITGTALREGFVVGGGSENGRIEDCQQNCGAVIYGQQSFRGPWAFCPNLNGPGGHKAAHDLVMADQWAHFDNYIMGNCRNEVLYNDFCFGGQHGLTLGDSGGAPSGVAFGTAFDQNTQDVHIDRIATDGFPIVDGQFVCVGSAGYPDSAYYYIGPQVQGDVHIEQSDLWGHPSTGIVVKGGHLFLDNTSFRNPGDQAFDCTAGTITATSLDYGRSAPLGVLNVPDDLSIDSALLPADLQNQPAAAKWVACVYK